MSCDFSKGKATSSTLSLSNDGVGYPCSKRRWYTETISVSGVTSCVLIAPRMVSYSCKGREWALAKGLI